MKSKQALLKGRLVAEVLSGSWRGSNSALLNITESDLDIVTPLLYSSGSAPLGWRRLSKTSLCDTASGELLHQAYRLQSLHSELQEQKIEKAFRVLRHKGIEAILAKGWAVARLYGDKTLRPYGDIDICVGPAQFKIVEEFLSAPDLRDCWIDLHGHFSEIDDRTFADLVARSRKVELRNESIRILGHEDQFALSCIHLLKHGAWRPLWLCDVGVAIESLPESFDWEICLGKNSTRANWILCAISLAQHLLSADTKRAPDGANEEPPAWLIDNVLKQWQNPTARNQPPMSHPVPIVDLLRHPSGLLDGLKQRWPNPILATISVNGRFNGYPRLPYQMANCLSRLSRLVLGRQGQLQEH